MLSDDLKKEMMKLVRKKKEKPEKQLDEARKLRRNSTKVER